MTLLDPCVVCVRNTHAMTLGVVHEKNTHAMTLGVVHEKNTQPMTLVDPCLVSKKNIYFNDTSGSICGM